jgi:aspartate aminotransferase
MNNAGFADVREKIAKHISDNSNVPVPASNVIMTVGAAGALNILFKTILNPGDEVIALAPYFMEYNFYADNYHGKIVPVMTRKDTFQPDLGELEKAIGERTKAIIINSPNNPTGTVYGEKCLNDIEKLLKKCEKKYGTTIFVVSDEPYIKIAYDGVKIPNMLEHFENAIIVNSFSKSLALAGERIGYAAVSSRIGCAAEIMGGLVFCNRVLGYVNAPALAQLVAADNLDAGVDVSAYAEKRDLFLDILTSAGFECQKPQGAFYLFPKIMGADDEQFKQAALRHNILIVPGFGVKGHFRAAYCVDIDTIRNSRDAFNALAAEYK